jgi:hypothetical protein
LRELVVARRGLDEAPLVVHDTREAHLLID